MAFISKSPKGKEFLFSRQYTIACKTRKQAEQLANYLNENDKNSIGNWKLNDNETWSVHDDMYGIEPLFKVRRKNGNISIVLNVRGA